MRFLVQSSAKVNLTLDIVGRLPNGYHTLRSVVHTIGLWDEMCVDFNHTSSLEFHCDRADLQTGDNLVLKAFRSWQKHTGESIAASVYLTKRIPSGAGLGGGSGNAAAILRLLNQRAVRPLTPETLATMGAELGADVPLFLAGGAMLMEGIGDRLTPLPPATGHLVVLKPELSLGTPAVYAAWDNLARPSGNDTEAMLAAMKDGGHAFAGQLGNDLQHAAAALDYDAARWTKLLLETGAVGASMTGSGSACFGVYGTQESAETAAAEIEARLAKDVQEKLWVCTAPLVPEGVRIAGNG